MHRNVSTPKAAQDSLAEAIKLLQEHGYEDVASKLQRETGGCLLPSQGRVDWRKAQKRSDVELGMTSSPESCGALSGPIASTCPSQVPSPTRSAFPQATTSAGFAAPGSRNGAGSLSHEEPSFTRYAVSNQAAFENQELVQLPSQAPGGPKVATPAGYFHGGSPSADFGLVPMSAALSAPASLTAPGALAPTQLPSSLLRVISPRVSPGVLPPTLSPRPPATEPAQHPDHLIRPLPIETDPDPATSASHYNTSRCNTPRDSPQGSRVGNHHAMARLSCGASAASSVGADIASLDGTVSWMGLPGSPMAGMSPRLSLPGNTGSLRGTSQRCGEENSVLAGSCFMSDPPDANDEAAGFMTYLSHNAWKSFMRHTATVARPSSISSLNEEAATNTLLMVPNPSLKSHPSSVGFRSPPVPSASADSAANPGGQAWCSNLTSSQSHDPEDFPPHAPISIVAAEPVCAAEPGSPRRSSPQVATDSEPENSSSSIFSPPQPDAPNLRALANLGSNKSRGTVSSGYQDSVSVFSGGQGSAPVRSAPGGRSSCEAGLSVVSTRSAPVRSASPVPNPCAVSSSSSSRSSSVIHGSHQREVSLMIDAHGYLQCLSAQPGASGATRGSRPRLSSGGAPGLTPVVQESLVCAHASCPTNSVEIGSAKESPLRCQSAPVRDDFTAAAEGDGDVVHPSVLSEAVTAAVLRSTPATIVTTTSSLGESAVGAAEPCSPEGRSHRFIGNLRSHAGEVSFGNSFKRHVVGEAASVAKLSSHAIRGRAQRSEPCTDTLTATSSSDPSFCNMDLRSGTPRSQSSACDSPSKYEEPALVASASVGDVVSDAPPAIAASKASRTGPDVDLSAGSVLACVDSAEPMPFFAGPPVMSMSGRNSLDVAPSVRSSRQLSPLGVIPPALSHRSTATDSSPRPAPLFSWNSPPGHRMREPPGRNMSWLPTATARCEQDDSASLVDASSEPSVFDLPASVSHPRLSAEVPDLMPLSPSPSAPTSALGRPRGSSADGTCLGAAAFSGAHKPQKRSSTGASLVESGMQTRSCSGIDLGAALNSPRPSWLSGASSSPRHNPPAASPLLAEKSAASGNATPPSASGFLFVDHNTAVEPATLASGSSSAVLVARGPSPIQAPLPSPFQNPSSSPPSPCRAPDLAVSPSYAHRSISAATTDSAVPHATSLGNQPSGAASFGGSGPDLNVSQQSHSLCAVDSGAPGSHSLTLETAALKDPTPDRPPTVHTLSAALSQPRRSSIGRSGLSLSGPFATGTLNKPLEPPPGRPWPHPRAPSASPRGSDWARVFSDGQSRFSSLHSSPAVSYRALSVHSAQKPLSVPGPTSTSGATSSRSNMTGAIVEDHDNFYGEEKCIIINLPVYHRPRRTGLEMYKEFKIAVGDVIAERYTVTKHIGSAAFSRVVAAADGHANNELVCLKIIRANKDFFDQSLDEIKLLQIANEADPNERGIVRLRHFFYWREHLVIVTELLYLNLYQCLRRSTDAHEAFFSLTRIRSISQQVLSSLAFLHGLGLIHCDLKPENIMVADFEVPRVKLIDLGSSCFLHDRLASYVQSRSYRAPEVVLRCGYNHKIDIWSLGCILAELHTGSVLFQGPTLPMMLARMEAMCGPMPASVLSTATHGHLYYTRSRQLYERDTQTGAFTVLQPLPLSLAGHLGPSASPAFVSFIESLLQLDPAKRPTSEEALQHPWIRETSM